MKANPPLTPKNAGLFLIGFLTIATMLTIALSPAYAQRAVRPRTSLETYDWLLPMLGVGLTLVGYVVLFHIVFPQLLHLRIRPFKAYGRTWFVFILILTTAVLVSTWRFLLPDRATAFTSLGQLYWKHALVALVGVAFSFVPLLLYMKAPSTT